MQIATATLRNCTIKSGRPPFLDMTINFQGAVYHRAGQYIDFYVLIVTWQHTYWSPTLITSPNITLWYWVSTSWQLAVKTYKSVCPALHAFRRCIVSCLQPVNTVVDHLLWLSRELSKFWENNPDHVIGVSQVLAYNVVYIYTHTHKESLRNKLWVWGMKDVGIYYQEPKIYSVFLEMSDSGRPTALETSFLRLRDSSTHPPPKKIVFLE